MLTNPGHLASQVLIVEVRLFCQDEGLQQGKKHQVAAKFVADRHWQGASLDLRTELLLPTTQQKAC